MTDFAALSDSLARVKEQGGDTAGLAQFSGDIGGADVSAGVVPDVFTGGDPRENETEGNTPQEVRQGDQPPELTHPGCPAGRCPGFRMWRPPA